jgi:NAD(P)-dependent dehydrogenase (short-subunit alcohol dehydrogenase family)
MSSEPRFSLDQGLAGKKLIVTGAAGGIGGAVLRLAVSAGIEVLATDIDAETLAAKVADANEAGPGRASAIVLDLTRPQEFADFVQAAARTLDGLDGLIHVAGIIQRQGDIAAITPAEFDLHVAINQRATFFLVRDVCERLAADSVAGTVVTTSSVGALTGGLNGAWAYGSTKAAVLAITRGLARHYGDRGIRINCVLPGPTETPMMLADVPEGHVELMHDSVMLGRAAVPEELAAAFLFLCSDASRFMTGSTVRVDGGWTPS